MNVQLIGATVIDWSRFLEGMRNARNHPAKTLDKISVKNNVLVKFLASLTGASDSKFASMGGILPESLYHASFTFCVECKEVCGFHLRNTGDIRCTIFPLYTEGEEVNVATGTLAAWQILVVRLCQAHFAKEIVELGNQLCLAFETMGLTAIWKEYSKEAFSGDLFVLVRI